MTQTEAVRQWQEGADRALKAAQDLFTTKNYEMVLFTCHLAVEKQLKARFVSVKDSEPPKTHDLVTLCEDLEMELSEKEHEYLSELSTFNAFARYGDESWVEAEATPVNCEHWLKITVDFLRKFAP